MLVHDGHDLLYSFLCVMKANRINLGPNTLIFFWLHIHRVQMKHPLTIFFQYIDDAIGIKPVMASLNRLVTPLLEVVEISHQGACFMCSNCTYVHFIVTNRIAFLAVT